MSKQKRLGAPGEIERTEGGTASQPKASDGLPKDVPQRASGALKEAFFVSGLRQDPNVFQKKQ